MSSSSFWYRRRVLVLSSSYPGSPVDARAWFVHEGARALAEAGAEVHVRTPAWGRTLLRERIENVEVERFAYPGFRTRPLAGADGIPENLRAHPVRLLSVPPFMASFIRSTRDALRLLRPDTVIGHWLLPTAWVAWAAGTPAVLFAHGSDVRWLRQIPGHRRLLGPLLQRSAVVPTSHRLAAELSEMGVKPTPPLPVGVRIPPAPEIATKLGPSPEAPARLCSFGRWVAGKGWPELMDAVEMVPHTSICIAGMGPLEGFLRRRAAELGPRVEIRGPVVGAEGKQRFFAEHDAFVFAGTRGSREDNLPISVLESLAHGVPVLSTRVGALTEILGPAEGWLVEPGPLPLAEAIRPLTRSLCLRRASAARARAESRSWDRVTASLADVAASVSAVPDGPDPGRDGRRGGPFGRWLPRP